MRENKRIIYISSVICVLTLLLSIYLNFGINTDISTYISNILLNIFAGAIMLIATSIIYYFVERRKTLTELMDECLKIRNLFNQVEYLDDYILPEIDDYKRFYKYTSPNLTDEDIEEMYNKNKIETKEKKYLNMEKIMKEYIQIANYDFTYFFNLYDKIDFLFSKKLKHKLYREVFDYTNNIVNLVREKVYHFNEYFNLNNGNKIVNFNLVRELQENIFYYEEKRLNDDSKWEEHTENKITLNSFDVIKNKKYIVYNKIVYSYNNLFDKIGKIAYFDKKYNCLNVKNTNKSKTIEDGLLDSNYKKIIDYNKNKNKEIFSLLYNYNKLLQKVLYNFNGFPKTKEMFYIVPAFAQMIKLYQACVIMLEYGFPELCESILRSIYELKFQMLYVLEDNYNFQKLVKRTFKKELLKLDYIEKNSLYNYSSKEVVEESRATFEKMMTDLSNIKCAPDTKKLCEDLGLKEDYLFYSLLCNYTHQSCDVICGLYKNEQVDVLPNYKSLINVGLRLCSSTDTILNKIIEKYAPQFTDEYNNIVNECENIIKKTKRNK